jgi:hypothetical protein
MRRLTTVPSVLALLLLLAQPPSASAQIPIDPPPVEETVDDVVQTVEDTVETTQDTVQTTQDTVQTTQDTVQTTQATAQPTADQTVQQTKSTADTATETVGSAGGGGATGSSGGTTSGSTGPGGSSPRSGAGKQSQERNPRGSAKGKSPRGAPQPPRLNPADRIRGFPAVTPLLVTKANDADGDFTFTSAETAPKPEANVPFEVSVQNQTALDVTLGEIVDYFSRGEAVEEVPVCNELTGRLLGPGEAVTCAFTLDTYSPQRGGRVINTIRVQGTVNHNGNNVSASGASTVTTAGEEVLGVVVEGPAESGLASTGAAILQLLRLAVLLGLTGVLFLAIARPRAEHLQGGFESAAGRSRLV